MGIKECDNLVKIGQLKQEPFAQSEFDNCVASGRERLQDAQSPSLSASGRFVLAYGAAYSFSLAALRKHGYRPVNRYVVFQCLPYTTGVGPDIWRVLAEAHDVRNGFEYEGSDEVTDDLTEQVIHCAKVLDSLL